MRGDGSRAPYDAVVAGGGAAGLSLLCHLARSPWRDRRVLLVDDGRRDPVRTAWAYWSTGDQLVDEVATLTFDRVRVHAGGADRTLALAPYRYRRVTRLGLRDLAERSTRDRPSLRMSHGHVDAVVDGPDGATVVVDGDPVRARVVFDSVSPKAPGGGGQPSLAFHGLRVVTDEPAFDRAVPTLFDFRTPQRGQARFVYVLPESERRALVEVTAFGAHPGPLDEAEATSAVRQYLEDTLGVTSYDVVGVERGLLSLAPSPPRARDGHVVAIGVAGGLLKRSTGYAFARIQRDSAALAAADPDGPLPRGLRSTARHRFLDAVLLDLVTHDPSRLESTFAALVAGVPVSHLFAFLDEDASLAQELALLRTLPTKPYARTALRLCVPAQRRGCAR